MIEAHGASNWVLCRLCGWDSPIVATISEAQALEVVHWRVCRRRQLVNDLRLAGFVALGVAMWRLAGVVRRA